MSGLRGLLARMQAKLAEKEEAAGGDHEEEDDDDHGSEEDSEDGSAGDGTMPAQRPAPALSSFDLAGVAEHILQGGASNVIVMCGAGISVSAGIPDFRTPGTGLYDNLQKYDLPAPEAIFELSYFRSNPRPFYTLAKELFPGRFSPTPTHHFLKLLADKGRLLRVFTQNIDSLETIAGLDKDLVVAAHGNFDAAHCIETGAAVDVEEVRRAILTGEDGPGGWRAMTERHGGLVKPDIVFFGESLPERFFKCAQADFPRCDLLVVMGTSLAVHPFASLVDMVAESVPRVLVNREKVGVHPPEMRHLLTMMGRGAGFEFEEDTRWRDVAVLGDCDTGVRQLADALGWTDDLEALVKAGGERFVQARAEGAADEKRWGEAAAAAAAASAGGGGGGGGGGDAAASGAGGAEGVQGRTVPAAMAEVAGHDAMSVEAHAHSTAVAAAAAVAETTAAMGGLSLVPAEGGAGKAPPADGFVGGSAGETEA